MRVVSLVPSWTETLLESGVEVVGRSRFCVHPAARVGGIPVVGGTKDVRWDRVAATRPDLLVLDREENTRAMADECPVPVFASHVLDVASAARDAQALALRLDCAALEPLAARWAAVRQTPAREPRTPADVPGVLHWIRRPEADVRRLLYVIWKDPWMAAGPATFIGSVLRTLGLGWAETPFAERYPRFELDALDPGSTLLLYSSEPYPFERRLAELERLPFPAALVDGELYGWFGLRALSFLERELGLAPATDA